jgi:hypothetical protein
MNQIYLIQEVNFDKMENTINDAISVETLGFVVSLEDAHKKIEELENENNNKYLSWESILDGKEHWYPKFNIEEVNKM